MKILRTTEMVHPLLLKSINTIDSTISKYNIPMRLFETGREHDRHQKLLSMGKTNEGISKHLFDLTNEPPLFCTALEYVYFDTKWSWNLRDSTIQAWYLLFGNLVLDICPELQWSGYNRKAVNYCHFELRETIIINNLGKFPCVIP